MKNIANYRMRVLKVYGSCGATLLAVQGHTQPMGWIHIGLVYDHTLGEFQLN